MANVNWTAIELDYINHQVLNKLYPKALNYNVSFEDFTKKGYDLILSNIPFLESRGLRINKKRPDIKALHDFYFLHALDLLNDNGLLVFITSIYTMDSKSKNNIREEIISKSDILNAFRLPVKHFAKSAHTDTPADIIILQKRQNGLEPTEEQKIKNSAFINTYSFSDNVILNDFYRLYPHNFLGNREIIKNRFGQEQLLATGSTELNKISFELQRQYTPTKTVNIEKENSIPTNSIKFEEWEAENKKYVVKKNISVKNNDTNGFNLIDQNFYESFLSVSAGDDFKYYTLFEEIAFSDITGKARIYKQISSNL